MKTYFELNVIVSLLLGFIGGLSAVRGLSGRALMAAGGIGLGVGVGMCIGIICLGVISAQITNKDQIRNVDKIDRKGSILALLYILLMLPLPYFSFATARWLVGVIFG